MIFSSSGRDKTTSRVAPATNVHGRGVYRVHPRFVMGCQRCWLAKPMYSPRRYSKSTPAFSTTACVPAARARNPGRVRERAYSPYAATRSASGGRDARLIWALAEASEVRSKDASLATIVSTKESSSVSGRARVTQPQRSAVSAS